MSSLSKLLRAAVMLALAFGPRVAAAQKALVYCPVSIDATGCATIKTALTSAYPGGIDTGFDGTQGTVDLKTVDLFQYSVVVVPSLADDSTAPYALLRDATVASKLKAALLGRRAFWSGTPDQGVLSTTRPQKDALIQNLAAWASGDFATVNAPGLVVLQDNSTDLTKRYDWVQAIAGFALIADTKLASYSAVSSLTAAGNAVLSSNGSTLAYANMASMGFQTPSGAPGTSLDAVGKTGTGVGGQVVLITQSGANTGGAVVTTDKDDYAPGTPVVITGTGFGAGETVTLTLHEDPTIEPDFSFTATADQNGGFVFTGFKPDSLDVDVRFVLTALGQTTGRRAQTTFTDANNFTITPATQTVAAGSTNSFNFVYTAANAGNNPTSQTIIIPAGWTPPQTGAGPGQVTLSTGTCTGVSRTVSGMTVTIQGTNTCTNNQTFTVSYLSAVAPSPATNTNYTFTSSVGTSPVVTVTAAAAKANQTITFTAPVGVKYGDPDLSLGATASSGLTVSYTSSTTTVCTIVSGDQLHVVSAGSCSITATQGGNASFNAAPDAPRTFTIGQATPAINWVTPSSIVFGTALGGTQLNATASVPGSFTYTPASGTVLGAGAAQTLSVSFTPNDAVNYATATKTVTIDVTKADPTITWATPANIVYGTALSSTQLNASTNSPGAITYSPALGTVLNGGPQTLMVSVAATQNFNAATKSVTLVVDQADQVITWANPADITYGTALSATQLNATTSGDGALTYSPVSGTVLGAGSGQTLTVNAAATTNYKAASKSVSINVGKATPAITWATPASITYGVALSLTQLNATSPVPGAFTYTPAAGAVLDAGSQTLSVSFAPTDAANYNPATATVTLAITKADPTITWNNPADIVYGTQLSSTQLNATSNSDGALTYTPVAGTLLGAGNAQTLSVSSAATTNYNAATKTVKINVSKADQTITWNDPPAITYGTALSASELDAIVTGVAGGSAVGAVTYSPVSGTVLNAGTHSLTVNVAGTTDYNPATKTVSLVVNKATPVVTWNAPANITYGTPLSNTQLDATANVPGSFLYSPAAGTLLNAGAQTLSVAFTPTDAANYNSAPQTTTFITVLKADPVITWGNPAGIVYGTALSGTQLNADVQGVPGGSPVGAVTYSPAAGVLLDAGTQTLQVDVASTNNYNAASRTVTIAVAKADQTITWSDPADIVYGTLLSGTQLNATVAGVTGGTAPGALTYTPPANTLLNAGVGQDLKVDAAATQNYNAATKSVKLTVLKATPTITWANPAGIVYGTLLSSTQLNAVASVPGTYTYTPAAGTLLNAGANQTLSVSFAPTDANNYNPASGTVSIDVAKADQTITWSNPGGIVYGTVLSGTQLNATVAGVSGGSAPGSLTYTPAAGTLLNAGAGQSLSVIAAATSNYNQASASVTIDVAKADQTITWSNPATIVYGTTLGATQLNASVAGVSGGSAPGALTYSPAAGTLLSAGTGQTLTVDAAATQNYNAANKSVTIDVSKAPQTITWANPAAITYPTTLSATQLNATVAGVTGGSATGALTYTPPIGTLLNAGNNQPLKLDVAGTSDYLPATKTVYIVVNKGTPVLTWATPADIPQGTPLSATQLNASANVPGSFAYTPAAGAVLLFGSNQLSTLFTPTDGQNYNTATAAVNINVTNVAPSALTLALPLPTEVTKPLTITGSFMDPGGQSDQHTVSFAWYSGTTLTTISSGTPTITYAGSTGNFSLTRSDIPTGVYWVRVTVKDKEGDSIAADGRYVVVYDPNGGFVTGGGWIVADVGSCIAANAPNGVCASATGGRANFGFVSKYQKGANTPSGNTEFQFQAGSLNFNSTAYQWLVIAGSKAQYKGQGTINGGSTLYNFMLTAVDGGATGGQGTDKFRIKITDASSRVVFDNQMGGDETTGTGSALGGGSIQVHDK